MKRLLAKDIEGDPKVATHERWSWHVDAQGRVMHRHPPYFLQHAAKTLYVREKGTWEKAGYWCDSCQVGLLLEQRSTGDVDSSRSTESSSRLL